MISRNVGVFLINLDRSPDRLENVSKNLKEVGLPFDRIAAVDGTKLDMDNIGSFALKKSVEKNKSLNSSAIGCSLSHYYAYKRFLATNYEWCLVLEDDVNFSPDVIDVVNSSILVMNKTDVFLLYFHGDEKSFSRNEKLEVDKNYCFYPVSTIWGAYSTGAYLIHRDVVHRLHDYVFPVHATADSYGLFHQDAVIGGLWAILPPVSRPTNFGSDIGYSRIGILLRRIEALKLPPITLVLRWARRIRQNTVTKYKFVDEVPTWLVERKR